MSDEQKPEDNFAEEFRNLGNNLLGALRSVWDSPERKRLTEELESNLKELSDTLRNEVETFNDSATGQRLRDDVASLHGKVRSEINNSGAKEDLLAALRAANRELSKVIERWSDSAESAAAEPDSTSGAADEASSSPNEG